MSAVLNDSESSLYHRKVDKWSSRRRSGKLSRFLFFGADHEATSCSPATRNHLQIAYTIIKEKPKRIFWDKRVIVWNEMSFDHVVFRFPTCVFLWYLLIGGQTLVRSWSEKLSRLTVRHSLLPACHLYDRKSYRWRVTLFFYKSQGE